VGSRQSSKQLYVCVCLVFSTEVYPGMVTATNSSYAGCADSYFFCRVRGMRGESPSTHVTTSQISQSNHFFRFSSFSSTRAVGSQGHALSPPSTSLLSCIYIVITVLRRRVNIFLLRECDGSPGGAVLMDLFFGRLLKLSFNSAGDPVRPKTSLTSVTGCL